jgi:pimeloyl-ACP methyl ester carboxylesterase
MSMDRYVESNGIRIHYLEHGKGGPTLLLMPGLTANCHSFGGLIEAGLSNAIRVIAVDLRGRGLSDHPDTGYSVEEQAADVLGVMDALDLERIVLGGHSYGGLMTYYLAANFPDRISKCVVIDTPIGVSPIVLEQARPSISRLGTPAPSWEAYLAAVRSQPYFDSWWDATIEEYFRADVRFNHDGTVQSRSKPENIMAALEAPMSIDWEETVARVAQPTLVFRATGGYGPPGYPPMFPRAQAERTIELLDDGRLVELEANHITIIFGDHAATLAGAIRDFVLG